MTDDLSSLLEHSANPSKPYLHELLMRDDAFKEQWNKWMYSVRYSDIQQLLYRFYLDNDDTGMNDNLQKHMHSGSNNIRILYSTAYFEKIEMQFLADTWKQLILQLQYKVYVSDVRHFMRRDYVEVIERHYLKPKIDMQDAETMVQQFGNIIIENRRIDDVPYDLQLQAHFYTGRNYTPAKDFNELLQVLFY